MQRTIALSIRQRCLATSFHHHSKFCTSGNEIRARTVRSTFPTVTGCYRAKSNDTTLEDVNKKRQKNALVLGSSGALGSTVARYLSRELGMCVIGVDVCELPNESDWELDGFVTVPSFDERPSLGQLTQKLVQGVDAVLGEDERLDVIICASGGWQSDPQPPKEDATQSDIEKAALKYGETIDRMMGMNLYPVAAAGFCAQRHMGKEGLFVVIGAMAALQPTPGMLGYGLSKCSAHFFVQTLGAITGKSDLIKSKRKESRLSRRHAENLDTMTVVGILPTTIDTPANRIANPKADFSQWTKPRDIAKGIGTWIETPRLRPHSGSLIKVAQPHSEGMGAAFLLVRA